MGALNHDNNTTHYKHFTVYHWYCAVSRDADGREIRGIALATS